MFPRLHVNDKGKGGPRAPPRNKMALYEQLSIPSQRFNPGLLPPKSPQTSSSKGICDARNLFVPSHSPPISNNLDEKLHSRLNGGANVGSLVTQIVREKREGDGDDCSVPVFVQSGTRQNVIKRAKTSNQQLQGERDGARRRVFSLDTNSKDDSQEKDNTNRTEAVSEISTVDSISCSDVSPDDIVGVMGQRRFWKARETIANQQRVFAFQLFELHRLIKVQQLMAGSPQLFIEDRVFLESSTPKVSPSMEISSGCIEKLPHPVMSSEASKKSNSRMECSVAESNMASWVFPHPPVHHWLVPVMSPAEGLVYKPCPAPGFVGNGVFPISPPTGYHCLHPYSIPPVTSTVSTSVADQTGSSSRSGSNRQPSCSYVPTQKGGLVASELQPRIGSCNCKKDRTRSSGHRNRVIKVVPRNPRSAMESAARIFRSIQEERKPQSM